MYVMFQTSGHMATQVFKLNQCRSRVKYIGGAQHERRRRELLGGSGGMPPREILVSDQTCLSKLLAQFTAVSRKNPTHFRVLLSQIVLEFI